MPHFHSYKTRSHDLPHSPFSKTTKYQGSFRINSAGTCNTLPRIICRVLSRSRQPANSATCQDCQDESSRLFWLWNLPLCAIFLINYKWAFKKYSRIFRWRNPLTRFQLESTTDYCSKLFYGSTVVTIGLRDLYQSHQSVNHEMSTFKWTSPNFYTKVVAPKCRKTYLCEPRISEFPGGHVPGPP